MKLLTFIASQLGATWRILRGVTPQDLQNSLTRLEAWFLVIDRFVAGSTWGLLRLIGTAAAAIWLIHWVVIHTIHP